MFVGAIDVRLNVCLDVCLQVLLTYASTYVLVALSIDRFDAIARPMSFSGGGGSTARANLRREGDDVSLLS